MFGVVQKIRGIVVSLFQRLNVDDCKFLLPNILDRYYKELNPYCLLPYEDPAAVVQSMFIHALSRVVVPARLHSISVNAHFKRFLDQI